MDKKLKLTRENSLLLGIDENEKIIKFNEMCERISGYNKNEILNINFFDVLIPYRYFKYWKNLVSSLRSDRQVADFDLPLLTKHGHEIMISWSGFPIKNADGLIYNIGFAGVIITSWDDTKGPFLEYPEEDIVKNLKKMNAELEKKNKSLEEEIQTIKANLNDAKNKKVRLDGKQSVFLNKGLYSFSELFGGKKKRQEFENKVQELDEREKLLNSLESKLVNEKREFNDKISELRVWREKLQSLEDDIENRERELLNRESLLAKHPSDLSDTTVLEGKKTVQEVEEYPDLFDIQDSAVVIQRGILKQVNNHFADLIGYAVDEIVEKSLFDFIVPEGFFEVEKFYLNRLTGEDVSVYETVLLSKDNSKVYVEISTKPTFFKGEKAELAVVKKIEKKKQEIKN
jgi:PAS domain S-box-containing protein